MESSLSITSLNVNVFRKRVNFIIKLKLDNTFKRCRVKKNCICRYMSITVKHGIVQVGVYVAVIKIN